MNASPSNGMVDSIFALNAKPGSPGCAVAVIKDGAVVYEQDTAWQTSSTACRSWLNSVILISKEPH